METIQLKEFIKTGSFGVITIASTKDNILRYLGNPSDSHDEGETQTIRYGQYEFSYWTTSQSVFGIQNDHLQADCTNHRDQIVFKNKLWELDNWFLRENTNATWGQVSGFLKNENIPFEIEPSQEDGLLLVKCTKSKVTFDFVSEFRIPNIDDTGGLRGWIENKENKIENFVLNGIRLYDLNR